MGPRAVLLPSPGVRFPEDFLGRLGRFVRVMRAARERREGAGRADRLGVGVEFVGYRPYLPGDDPRLVDWSLYARLERPYVRVARREASERWAVLLDTSASMGVGEPGKLQRAAEVSAAILAAGALAGAAVDLWTSARTRLMRLRRPSDLGAALAFLEEERAEGERGIGALASEPARLRGAGRLFAVGDLLDLEPRALLPLVGRSRELSCVQLLAPEELVPDGSAGGPGGPVEWIDAERGTRMVAGSDAATLDAYEGLLHARLEAWRTACAHHRASHGCWSSARPFETIVRTLFD